jgi:hypothetical protein
MKLHFVVGPFGEGRESFSKLLVKQFNQLEIGNRFCSCGSLNCLDNYGGITALNLDFCLDDILMNIESAEEENLIFSGVGLSLYIKQIVQQYPAASIYFVKSSKSKLETDPLFKEAMLMLVDDITEDWILKTNEKINSIIDEFENTNPLNWKTISGIPEHSQVAKL